MALLLQPPRFTPPPPSAFSPSSPWLPPPIPWLRASPNTFLHWNFIPPSLKVRAHAAGLSTKAEDAENRHQRSPIPPFHLAIPVHNVQAARDFYGEILGCPEGRSAKTWVDFNLYGHQVVCHHVPNYNAESSDNAVDGDAVPVPHFGLAMTVMDFLQLAERVKAKGIRFIIEPHIRFKGQPGEQWTMFFKDTSGNSLEFKAMTNPINLFAKYVVDD